MKKLKTSLALLLVCLFVFAGCSGSSSNREDSFNAFAAPAVNQEYNEAKNAQVTEATQANEAGAMEADAAGTPAAPAPAPAPEYGDRKIILNANAQFETVEFDTIVQDILQLVSKHGGYTQSSGLDNNRYNSRFANYTFRIPAKNYTAFIQDISQIEFLLSLNEGSNDVTQQYIDTESRLRTLELEKERLETFLSQASQIEDLIALQQRLSDVQYQIESYTTSKQTLDNLITYSTVDISVREVKTPTEIPPETFGSQLLASFKYGIQNAVDTIQNLILWVARNLFALLFFAILLAIVLVLVQKQRKKKLSGASSSLTKAPIKDIPESKPTETTSEK